MTLGLCLSARHISAHTWRLGYCLSAGHTLVHTWRWAACIWVKHSPAHTWRLGCVGWAMIAPHLVTSGAWIIALDPRGMGPVLGPTINGSCVRTQFYWVLHQNSKFLGPRILNIIICFRNIIIFIIINIINKIINKFERKYYY